MSDPRRSLLDSAVVAVCIAVGIGALGISLYYAVAEIRRRPRVEA